MIEWGVAYAVEIAPLDLSLLLPELECLNAYFQLLTVMNLDFVAIRRTAPSTRYCARRAAPLPRAGAVDLVTIAEDYALLDRPVIEGAGLGNPFQG